MRHILSIALISFGLPALAQDVAYDPAILTGCLEAEREQPAICIGKASAACMDSDAGSTTVGMVECLSAEADQWAAIMEDARKVIQADAERSDAELKDLGSAAEPQAPRLAEMQQNWAAFRDAACGWEASRWGGGTGAGPAAAGCDMRLTGQQAVMLKAYADETTQ